MTDRQRLEAAGRAAGLQFSAADVEALLPAWQRYLEQVARLKASMHEWSDELCE